MEALWKLEDKWKVSTKTAIIICICTSSLLIAAMCIVLFIRKSKGSVDQEPPPCTAEQRRRRGAAVSGEIVKRVLMGSVRWSGKSAEARRKGGGGRRWRRSSAPPLLRGEVGWQSNNSESPVWQRPILMGEKCELPRFSGLILYDDRGLPLNHDLSLHHHEVDMPDMETVSLRELFAL